MQKKLKRISFNILYERLNAMKMVRYSLFQFPIFILLLIGCSSNNGTSNPDSQIANSDGNGILYNESGIPLTDGSQQVGDGGLIGDGRPIPQNSYCASPKELSWVDGKIEVTGSTEDAVDEFTEIPEGAPKATVSITCNNQQAADAWNGPQVYYKVNLTGGKRYKVSLMAEGNFDAALYAFPAKTACVAKDINLACTNPTPEDPNNVYSSDFRIAEYGETIRIAPTDTEDWIIVVDSIMDSERGKFTFTVSEVAPPDNMTCAKAKALVFNNGEALESGDLRDATNEFGSAITCGEVKSFAGPQLYYKLTVESGKEYQFILSAKGTGFTAYMYLFRAKANCDSSAIQTDCISAGKYGDRKQVISGAPESWGTLVFAPEEVGEYILAIDSVEHKYSGYFDLKVKVTDKETNGKCITPQIITLETSPTKVEGDTQGMVNEYGTEVKCKRQVTGASEYSYTGQQAYYQVSLLAGKTYLFKVTTENATLFWDHSAYAFVIKDTNNLSTSCVPSYISTQCSSGLLADENQLEEPEKLTITPSTNATYMIVVDSKKEKSAGSFTITITW